MTATGTFLYPFGLNDDKNIMLYGFPKTDSENRRDYNVTVRFAQRDAGNPYVEAFVEGVHGEVTLKTPLFEA